MITVTSVETRRPFAYGVLLGKERGRAVYAVVPWREALDILAQIERTGAPVVVPLAGKPVPR